LFKTFAEVYRIQIIEVVINKFSEGVFYAKLVCTDGKNEQEVDSRTSDAIALALRFNCPIFTYESIMVAAGILIDEESENNPTAEVKPETSSTRPSDFSELSLTELKELLQTSIDKEEYEKASKIRDEINKRK